MSNVHDHEGKKYLRTIPPADGKGQWIEVDVYSVLMAFNVTCPAVAHACKKLLCAGERGKGDKMTDLTGALAALHRAIDLEKDRIAAAEHNRREKEVKK